MIKKRLLKLADRLERIAAKPPKKRRFDLNVWFLKHTVRGSFECGTECCAIGEASLIPEFRDLGFKIHKREPEFKHAFGWPAVVILFGLGSFAQAFYLFSAEEYDAGTGPGEVAARIREFVASGGDTQLSVYSLP